MSESLKAEPEPPLLVVPASIEDVIAGFDSRTDVYSGMDVHSALCATRQALEAPTPSENAGAWAEVLAFGLTGTEHNEKPWETYFGPMGSGTRENGETVYFPDVTQADATILTHWKSRARSSNAPVLVARYADLVWDLGKLIANEKRDVAFARLAIDAYVATAKQDGRDAYDAFPDAKRALALSIQIDDATRRDAARAALLALHKRAVAESGMWWKAYDALEAQPKSGLTESERSGLIDDLEIVLACVADTSDQGRFDPHMVEGAANKLITHYRRTGRNSEVQRLHLAVAKAFEHFGSTGDAMLASMVLQTSMDAYRQAGMNADAERILRLIEKSNVASVAQMTRHEHVQEIPVEVVEEFLVHVVVDTKEGTFQRLAGEFLTKRAVIEEALKKSAKSSPLATMIPRSKLQGDRIVAHIGSLDDDPMGHLIEQTNMHLAFNAAWLRWALDRARERHAISADDITAWANRTGLFGDGRLLHEGVAAWMADDHIKAAHILVPQVEAGLRTLVGRRGRPTTKAHRKMKQARVVITMGDILFHEDTAPALGSYGPDIVLHFRTLYADPRGHNLRNDIAHGLLAVEHINAGTMLWIVHSLLLLGAWLKPEGEPSGDSAPTPDAAGLI
jgi:hypothetical protein